MPGLLLEMDSSGLPIPKAPEYGFVVSSQKVELDVDFSTMTVSGCCEITILPQTKDLREIKIDARQCDISAGVMVNGKLAEFEYEDPMEKMDMLAQVVWGVEQHGMQTERLKQLTGDRRAKGALVVKIPKTIRVEELDPFSENAAPALAQRAVGAMVGRTSSMALDSATGPLSATPTLTPKTAAEQAARFQPLVITVPFETKNWREGLHFVGLGEGDARYPHVYTRHSTNPGTASCIFPCVDDPAMRCTWEIYIKCCRTLGEALKRKPAPKNHRGLQHTLQKKGLPPYGPFKDVAEEFEVPLSDEEKLLDMTVVCSGEQMNETTDLEDSFKKVVSFIVNTVVAPQHIGFAIGPFEQVDLSEYREVEDDEKLGQGQTVPVTGYCLPGRADELRHTCAPMAHALDYFLLNFAAYPFSECRFVFVDDQLRDAEHTASLSLCSSRLLFGEDIIDPELENIRTLVHAIASQWIGVSVVPDKNADRWVTIGLSHFMTGLFMKTLCGDNEYAFRQKELTDKLVEEDVGRPSLSAIGEYLHIAEYENFLALKAPLVIFILDRRIVKASGSTGLTRVISKIIVQSNTGSATDSVISNDSFQKTIEKITKYRQIESFFGQWVLKAGCPRFTINQKFNKKRLIVEMTIVQKQDQEAKTTRYLERESFMREFQEYSHNVYAPEVQPVFTGPLTIRIHEADGTPYEHIVDIREGSAKIEIPYNTKYKRLKRSRRQKERANAGPVDISGEATEDALYYCLGDVLTSPHDIKDWGLHEWNAEQEQKMEQESYEWIRVDADFEWLCKKTFTNIESYMYVSELQQDRDIVAQHDAMQFLGGCKPHPLVATFLVRTLVDPRYFHGIRKMAAKYLSIHATKASSMIGLKLLERVYHEFFCYEGTKMPKSNDFTDKRAYQVEKAIASSLAQIRVKEAGIKGLVCPKGSRHLLLDMLRFNDNTNNEYSDNFKVANLLDALADSLIPIEDPNNVLDNDDRPTGVVNGTNGESSSSGHDALALSMGLELEPVVDPEPEEFKKTVIEELDRYCRMDEWINSHRNIFTITVLGCKERLMKAKVIPTDPVEFAQYLHDGTSDEVRIKAFGALVDLGYMKHDSVLTLLLNTLSTDCSAYTRSRLFEIFMLGLADIAFGDPKLTSLSVTAPKADGNTQVNGDMLLDASGSAPQDGSLIIDEDVSLEARKVAIERLSTIDGAVAALKKEMQGNLALREALWKAISSGRIGVKEQSNLLDLCAALYEAVYSMEVVLKKPRYIKAKHLGKGVILFEQKGKFREKPLKPWKNPEAPKPLPLTVSTTLPPMRPSIPSASGIPARQIITLKTSTPQTPNSPQAMLPPATVKPTTIISSKAPSVPKPSSAMKPPPKRPSPFQESPRPTKILKLKAPATALRNILSKSPNPTPAAPRAKSTSSSNKSASPAPRWSPSPAVSSSTIVASPLPASVRKPLPEGGRKPLPQTRTPLPQAGSTIEIVTPTSTGRKPLPGTPVPGARKPLPDNPPVVEAATPPVKKKFMVTLKTGRMGGFANAGNSNPAPSVRAPTPSSTTPQ